MAKTATPPPRARSSIDLHAVASTLRKGMRLVQEMTELATAAAELLPQAGRRVDDADDSVRRRSVVAWVSDSLGSSAETHDRGRSHRRPGRVVWPAQRCQSPDR